MDFSKNVRKINETMFALTCCFCRGEGLYPDENNDLIVQEPCPVCVGKGINVFEGMVEEFTQCAYCK